MSITEKQDNYICSLAGAVISNEDIGWNEKLSLMFCGKHYKDIDSIDAGVLISVLNAAKSAQYQADLKRESKRTPSVAEAEEFHE